MTRKIAAEAENRPMYDFAVLRELRKREKLTLQEVSRRSSISVAVISRLERNQSVAELETLFKLGRVFGMSATDLLALAEAPLSHRIKSTRYRSDGFQFEKIAYANATVFHGEAAGGSRVSRPEIHRDDTEICWVRTGRIRLCVGEEVYELDAGESVQFDAIQSHTYEALSDCTLILLHIRKEKRY